MWYMYYEHPTLFSKTRTFENAYILQNVRTGVPILESCFICLTMLITFQNICEVSPKCFFFPSSVVVDLSVLLLLFCIVIIIIRISLHGRTLPGAILPSPTER